MMDFLRCLMSNISKFDEQAHHNSCKLVNWCIQRTNVLYSIWNLKHQFLLVAICIYLVFKITSISLCRYRIPAHLLYPVRACLYIHGSKRKPKSDAGQTYRNKMVIRAFCSILACALRSPLVAFGPRRWDAVVDREVFESYTCHIPFHCPAT